MAKGTQKPRQIQNHTINSVLTENKTSPKSKQQIDKENYQKNKERKKAQQKINYAKKKQQEQLEANKYYQAHNIKVLISLKEYTELSQHTKKTWLDFTATLHELNQGITAIEEIMRLEQLAGQLIKDYRETAKGKIKQGITSWNSLTEEQQAKLIKYWGREKVRIENNFLTTTERLEREGEQWEKEIEIAKFHEERGKEKCDCWQCAASKQIRAETKAKLKKDVVDSDRQSGTSEKEQCPECQKWVKKLDENSGVCKNCLSKYET